MVHGRSLQKLTRNARGAKEICVRGGVLGGLTGKLPRTLKKVSLRVKYGKRSRIITAVLVKRKGMGAFRDNTTNPQIPGGSIVTAYAPGADDGGLTGEGPSLAMQRSRS